MDTMKVLVLAILLTAAPRARGVNRTTRFRLSLPRLLLLPLEILTPSDDRPALQQRNPRYQVQRDDVLIISFALSPELNQTVTIQPDGYINLQNAGSTYVLGMTVPEVVAAVKKAYVQHLARSYR